MNIRIIREELRQVFEAMSEQMEIIQEHKEKIPQIEIDLFMSNVRDLYEACVTLNKLNAKADPLTNPDEADLIPREIKPIQNSEIPIRETFKFISQVEEVPEPIVEETVPKATAVPFEALVPEPISVPDMTDTVEPEDLFPVEDSHEQQYEPQPEDLTFTPVSAEAESEEDPDDEFDSEEDLEPMVLISRESEPEPAPVPEPESVPEPEHEPIVLISREPAPIQEAEPEPIVLITRKHELVEPAANPTVHSPNLFSSNAPTIADRLKEDKTTLNQRLQSESQHTSVGARLHQNQIRDLKSAIGINEKFQFINDLFKGNMQDYTLAMTQLNQFSTFEEALEYIDILKFKYTWDINSDAHHKLMDFVRRRYL